MDDAAEPGQHPGGGWVDGPPRWIEDETPIDDHEGVILCGRSVDGNHVLSIRPAGVVTEIGSLLSHVAIVCRELGIPLVAGVAVRRGNAERLTVDGWTGQVHIERSKAQR